MSIERPEEARGVPLLSYGTDDEFEYQVSNLNGSTPLLRTESESEIDETESKPHGPGFFWIQAAIFSNVFLAGFDGTITASTYAVIGSDFNAANTISWITTAYLITSTAFQPLYGRFSDILGRRTCFLIATMTFLLGCLGCGLAPNIILLDLMRALAGLGGGGLITMATIINSDIIPLENRGMYQAVQNGFYGFGAICGASIGGILADTIGWRWCFGCQVPIAFAAMLIGYFVIINPPPADRGLEGQGAVGKSLWTQIDLSGAVLLVFGLSAQLAALSLGGNQYPWSDIRVIICLVASFVILGAFIWVELKTKALPVMPMLMLQGIPTIANTISNILVGMSSFAFLFMIPLFFQVVLKDSASKAGLRLAIPSLATPVGGLIAGFIMSRWGLLSQLVRAGCFFMVLGNGLICSLRYHDSTWKYILYLFPANVGQGIVFPSILFTNISAFEQSLSTSMVYLFRSMGMVWGVAAASTIIQNVLSSRLPSALSGIPKKEKKRAKIIEDIRHSVTVLRDLDPEIQDLARRVYFDALRYTFIASTAWAAAAFLVAFFTKGKRLDRK
ncbi:putative transporter [Hyphodiscus hymeniophilus]|uniref:Transporter n=1 Tax=Hyphodiscus hymeniophilus TaxID=353542 RepID=A0A9P6VL51_9HELO|nr:putative transporter [Hyphodiscus hymeniophilus]